MKHDPRTPRPKVLRNFYPKKTLRRSVRPSVYRNGLKKLVKYKYPYLLYKPKKWDGRGMSIDFPDLIRRFYTSKLGMTPKPAKNLTNPGCKSSSKQIILDNYQLFAADYLMQMKSDGLLLWHNTGSGKTCTALAIIANYFKVLEKSGTLAFVLVPAKKDIVQFYNQIKTDCPSLKNVATDMEIDKNKKSKNSESEHRIISMYTYMSKPNTENKNKLIYNKNYKTEQNRIIRNLQRQQRVNKDMRVHKIVILTYKAAIKFMSRGTYSIPGIPPKTNIFVDNLVLIDEADLLLSSKKYCNRETPSNLILKMSVSGSGSYPQQNVIDALMDKIYESKNKQLQKYFKNNVNSANVPRTNNNKNTNDVPFTNLETFFNTFELIKPTQQTPPVKVPSNNRDSLLPGFNNISSQKLVLMTATPYIDKEEDIVTLLKLIKPFNGVQTKNKINWFNPPGKPTNAVMNNEVNRNTFIRNKIYGPKDQNMDLNLMTGIISYYNNSNDTTLYPRVEYDLNAGSYVMSKIEQNVINKKISQMQGTRNCMHRSSNILLASTKCHNPKIDGIDLSEVPKIRLLLDNIRDLPDRRKHVIYVGEKRQGTRIVEKFLNQSDVKFKSIYTTHSKSDVQPVPQNTEATDIIAEFNDVSNAYGEKIRVLIIQGKDYLRATHLAHVRYLHILSPLSNPNEHNQLIGRVARRCSHEDLVYPHEWDVRVIPYMIANADEYSQSANQKIRTTRENKIQELHKVLDAAMHHAVDRDIHNQISVQTVKMYDSLISFMLSRDGLSPVHHG
jgi:hypothetical protein